MTTQLRRSRLQSSELPRLFGKPLKLEESEGVTVKNRSRAMDMNAVHFIIMGRLKGLRKEAVDSVYLVVAIVFILNSISTRDGLFERARQHVLFPLKVAQVFLLSENHWDLSSLESCFA
eukprot:Gregarina_sp_Poly_1__5110@NODE_2704_length_1808_cov_34_428489_g1715_i0_p1_GENE_NODE_2704_length_1808_cov_34_428489_g1715_i0NODE_2704_length_1808_cov_34_428489_g1715_i0_p1_ORF_typecomplete_len119_score11_25_NODE_2704_length_1808_cov_34_428489_g1715_i08921248